MEIALIVAMDEKSGIGYNNDLPWRLPDELRRFKQLTMGHHLIVGRKTYESIGRPLPGRRMIVLTRQPNYAAPGCHLANSLESGLALAHQAGEDLVFIAGGSQVFAEALPLAKHLFLTRVHARLVVDTFFPDFDLAGWQLVECDHHPADHQHAYAFTFYHYQR